MTTTTLTPAQHDRPSDNMAVPMATEVTKVEPMTAIQRLKEELKSKRNLDVGFTNDNFNIAEAIDTVMELDKYTKASVLNSIRFYLNMQSIRQALRILRNDNIELGDEKTVEMRDAYDQLIRRTMDEYEKDGDYAPSLPAFIALNEHLRVTMYDDNLQPVDMESTLDFMCSSTQGTDAFEKDYDARVKQGMKPGISKREFVEQQLRDAVNGQRQLQEQGQYAIQFCEDLNVNVERGFSDLPDWAITAIHDKIVDKLHQRWVKCDMRRTSLNSAPNVRSEAEADQLLIECAYEQIAGRKIVKQHSASIMNDA
jgi:hypothetical protein